jgi:hypothetical protein
MQLADSTDISLSLSEPHLCRATLAAFSGGSHVRVASTISVCMFVLTSFDSYCDKRC